MEDHDIEARMNAADKTSEYGIHVQMNSGSEFRLTTVVAEQEDIPFTSLQLAQMMFSGAIQQGTCLNAVPLKWDFEHGKQTSGTKPVTINTRFVECFELVELNDDNRSLYAVVWPQA